LLFASATAAVSSTATALFAPACFDEHAHNKVDAVSIDIKIKAVFEI